MSIQCKKIFHLQDNISGNKKDQVIFYRHRFLKVHLGLFFFSLLALVLPIPSTVLCIATHVIRSHFPGSSV